VERAGARTAQEAGCQANGHKRGVQGNGGVTYSTTLLAPPVSSPCNCSYCNHEPASDDAPPIAIFGGTIADDLTVYRIAGGLALAIAIAVAAHRARALSRSGSGAAIVLGSAAAAAGWDWAALLVMYFLSSVALTRFRGSVKSMMVRMVAKGGPRDAAQVLANGSAFACAALLWIVTSWSGWRIVGAGALAAAASDTWATEIGTLAKHAPRSIVTWRRVPTGMSGGVSGLGIAGAIAGALFVALLVLAFRWPARMAVAAFAGGIAGSTIDSLAGATVQERRRCDRCDAPTERRTHTCGAPTRIVAGIAGIDNDVVNAFSTLAGGLLALAVGG
jgi:uncharacterized protein (TIGR00297 family)